MAETRCRVCRAIITDESRLDETGRCLGCRRAKEATDVGMTYGKYEGMMDSNAPWMRKLTAVQRPRQEEDGDAGRRKNGAVVRKHRCQICGSVFEFQRSSKKYCSPECRSKAAEAGLYTGNERSGLCDVCGKKLPDRRLRYCSEWCKCQAAIRREAQQNEAGGHGRNP